MPWFDQQLVRRGAVWVLAAAAVTPLGCASLRRQKVTPDSVAQCRQLSREGVAALERGDAQRARQLLDEAVETSPSDLDARRELAEVLWRQGVKQDAAVHMEAAVKLNPRHAPTIVRSGEFLLELGAVDRAMTRAEEAMALDSSLAGAWALRGRAHRRRGELDRALADLQQSLRYNPHDAEVLVATAELQFQLGRPQRCLSTIHHLLDASREDAPPRRALWLEGLAYNAVGRRADAVNSLLAASRCGPAEPELLFQLARAQQAAGQPEAAAGAAREALALDGSNEACRAFLAQLEGIGGDGVTTPLRR